MAAPGTMGTAYLRKRTEDGGTETIYLPQITNLETTFTAQLTEISTIIFGYENMFCMDMGNSMKFNLTCKRVNPFPYDDHSSNPENWSNGKWYREYIEPFFNYWQNLGQDAFSSSDVLVGGFRFIFEPSDTTIHSRIDRNVFLSGSINAQYSTTYMVVQIPLQVARMQTTESGTGSTLTVTLHMMDYNAGSGELTYEVQVPENFSSNIPYCPSEWESLLTNIGLSFRGWALSYGGELVYEGGETHTYTEPMDLYVLVRSPVWIRVYDEAGSYTFGSQDEDDPLPADAYSLRIYCVGGGGGAGNCSRANDVEIMSDRNDSGAAGGAGAGGNVRIMNYTISRAQDPYPEFTVVVGAGGRRGDDKGYFDFDGKKGHTGGTSYVTGPNLPQSLTEAAGGEGGEGGSYLYTSDIDDGKVVTAAGGSSPTAPGGGTTTRQDGEDGGTTEPNIGSNVGKGMAYIPKTGVISDEEAPGAGGGAAAFRYHFYVNGTWYPSSTTYYESKGGNGGGYTTSSGGYQSSTDGVMGGGGGSGPPTGMYNGAERGASGGDGVVIILAFRQS